MAYERLEATDGLHPELLVSKLNNNLEHLKGLCEQALRNSEATQHGEVASAVADLSGSVSVIREELDGLEMRLGPIGGR